MTTEDGFPERFDVRDPFVESNYNRQAPEEQDKDGDDDQSPDSEAQNRIVEIVEGCPSSDVHETSNIEEKIDDGTEHGLLGLSVEETIPGESGTATKSGKEIVGSEHRSSTDYQKGEGNILGDV